MAGTKNSNIPEGMAESEHRTKCQQDQKNSHFLELYFFLGQSEGQGQEEFAVFIKVRTNASKGSVTEGCAVQKTRLGKLGTLRIVYKHVVLSSLLLYQMLTAQCKRPQMFLCVTICLYKNGIQKHNK